MHIMFPGRQQICLHGTYEQRVKFKFTCLKYQICEVQQSVTKDMKGNLNISKLATATLYSVMQRTAD